MFPKERGFIRYEELLQRLQLVVEILLQFKGSLVMLICKWQQGMCRMFLRRRTALLKIVGSM